MHRLLAVILFLMVLLSICMIVDHAAQPSGISTAFADTDVFVIEMVPTPTPVGPTAPPEPTPKPKVVITKHDNDIQTIDIAARAAYHSPFDQLYWKFVYWCVMYNRTVCSKTINGVRMYSAIFIEVATNTNEYETWTTKMPNSKRGKEILHLNNIAANLFFDYIKSGGAGYIVPLDGVILEYVKNADGLNRSANVYNLDGRQLEIMSKEEFAETIGAEYYRRIGEQ